MSSELTSALRSESNFIGIERNPVPPLTWVAMSYHFIHRKYSLKRHQIVNATDLELIQLLYYKELLISSDLVVKN